MADVAATALPEHDLHRTWLMMPLTLARLVTLLAFASIVTLLFLIATRGAIAAAVLATELFAIVVVGLMLSADLRPSQRHRVR
jgi:hypothetical protein